MKETILKGSCICLFPVLAIIAYSMWNNANVAEQQRTEQIRKDIAERNHKIKILNCIRESIDYYNQEWSNSCKEHAKNVAAAYQNCINRAAAVVKSFDYLSDSSRQNFYLQGVSICRSTYGTPNPTPNCSLPSNTANSLNSQLEKTQEFCKEYADELVQNSPSISDEDDIEEASIHGNVITG